MTSRQLRDEMSGVRKLDHASDRRFFSGGLIQTSAAGLDGLEGARRSIRAGTIGAVYLRVRRLGLDGELGA